MLVINPTVDALGQSGFFPPQFLVVRNTILLTSVSPSPPKAGDPLTDSSLVRWMARPKGARELFCILALPDISERTEEKDIMPVCTAQLYRGVARILPIVFGWFNVPKKPRNKQKHFKQPTVPKHS